MYGQRCWVIPFRRKEKAKALTKDVDSFLRLCPCGLPQAGLNIQHVTGGFRWRKRRTWCWKHKKMSNWTRSGTFGGKHIYIYRYIDAILKDAAVTHSWTLVVLTIQNHSLKNGLYKSRGAESTCELDDQDVRCLPSELSFFFGLNQRETVLLETYKASGSLHFQVMWPLWCTNKTASCEQSYAGDVHIGKLKLQFFWWHNPVIDGP